MGGGYLCNFLLILVFFGESMASNDLRSMGGLQVASGWLMQTPLRLFVLAGVWLARSQWVAYVNFFGVICYSQWVACTDPLTLCVLASGWLA